MQNSGLLFNHSPWFLLLCIFGGLVYAFLLYNKKSIWSKITNYLLFSLRFLVVSFLAFLLLGPFFRQINSIIEKPTFVIAVDNSSSIASVSDSTTINRIISSMEEVKDILERQDHNVELMTLSDKPGTGSDKDIKFDHEFTDLNNLLKTIQSDFEGRNLAGAVLLTDGIYNQGVSPNFVPYNFDIFTVGLGDTVPKIDLNLKTLFYNKIAYQGNKFPLVAEIINTGFSGEEITVTVKRNNKTLLSKNAVLSGNNQVTNVEFILDADQKGIQHYIVEVQPKDNEFTLENNNKHAYIDIVEGKEKILVVAMSPHPDIKAINNALDKSENYELSVYIPGLHDVKDDKFDLVIFHQVPGLEKDPKFIEYQDKKIPKWFILGNNTNINQFNNSNKILKVNIAKAEKDRVTPSFNDRFTTFNFKPEFKKTISSFPPVSVPFGKYAVQTNAEVLLFQKVGNVVTDNPLLIIGKDGDAKSAVLAGEGIWQWRLHEFAKTGKQEAFDELILKTIQYLSAKEDKRKFRTYPINNEYIESEVVAFENEIYNDIFERIYNQEVHLEITPEDGKKQNYTYLITEANSQFKISGLSEGIYKYKATASINGRTESSEGAFTVKSVKLEVLNLTANHNMLRKLSEQNNGKFYHHTELNVLMDDFNTKKAQGIITSNAELLPVINMRWLFFVLLIMISTEWFIRKYSGGY